MCLKHTHVHKRTPRVKGCERKGGIRAPCWCPEGVLSSMLLLWSLTHCVWEAVGSLGECGAIGHCGVTREGKGGEGVACSNGVVSRAYPSSTTLIKIRCLCWKNFARFKLKKTPIPPAAGQKTKLWVRLHLPILFLRWKYAPTRVFPVFSGRGGIRLVCGHLFRAMSRPLLCWKSNTILVFLSRRLLDPAVIWYQLELISSLRICNKSNDKFMSSLLLHHWHTTVWHYKADLEIWKYAKGRVSTEGS